MKGFAFVEFQVFVGLVALVTWIATADADNTDYKKFYNKCIIETELSVEDCENKAKQQAFANKEHHYGH